MYKPNNFQLNYAGIVILFCLVLGGGTNQNLWSDHLLQIIMLPLSIVGITNIFESRIGNISKGLVLSILVLLVIQFIPLMGIRGFPVYSELSTNWSFWSISPSRSLEASLFTIAILGFSLFVAQLNDYQQKRLIRFIALGFVINILIGIIQLSFGSRITITGVLPYNITSGMFANENHFSSLIYIMLPLFAWRFLTDSKKPWAYLTIAGLIVFFEFAIGSRAGMAISLGLALFSFFWAIFAIPTGKYKLLIYVLITATALIEFYVITDLPLATGVSRTLIFSITWEAIQDHWLTGTGLGSFLLVIPMFEKQKDIYYVYINQAHNEYLQLFLELGIVIIPMILLFLVQIIQNMFNSKLSKMATISLLAIMAHSTVDYPLRTMAIAIVFGTLSAIVLSERNDRSNQGLQ